MRINQKLRNEVYQKYGGRCAYSGTLLQDDWQIDHIVPKARLNMIAPELRKRMGFPENINDIENLMPAQRIINHYKGYLSLDEFRNWYLGGLHKRLKKLPKNPKVEESIRRKEYLLEVAALFDIAPDKPFDGVFYFESI